MLVVTVNYHIRSKRYYSLFHMLFMDDFYVGKVFLHHVVTCKGFHLNKFYSFVDTYSFDGWVSENKYWHPHSKFPASNFLKEHISSRRSVPIIELELKIHFVNLYQCIYLETNGGGYINHQKCSKVYHWTSNFKSILVLFCTFSLGMGVANVCYFAVLPTPGPSLYDT